MMLFLHIPSRRKFIELLFQSLVSVSGIGVLSVFAGFRKKERSRTAADRSVNIVSRNTARAASGHQSGPDFKPSYLQLHRSGEMKKRADELWGILLDCKLCPRECGDNKLLGKEGECGSTSQLEISSFQPHFGEEKPLVGKEGSGTIFFTNCALKCVFCINWEISQGGYGSERSVEELAAMMLILQEKGCHNINFVTPTHYSPHIVEAIDIAAGKGLRIPLVYNTHGYERLEILRKLEGIIDIYLPDIKYSDEKMAIRYSSEAEGYPGFARNALLEMHRQVGVARPAPDGLMYRGLMIRHLVMPNNVSGSAEVISWIAENLPKDTWLNIMSQYRPEHKAFEYPEIARRITRKEYREVVDCARDCGLTNLSIQGAYLLV